MEVLRKLCKEGRLVEALQATHLMEQQGIHVSPNICYCILQGCINKKDLIAGKELHCLIIRSGFESNAFLGTHLIRMFTLCGDLMEANKVFHQLQKPNVFAWCAVISAHARIGQAQQAIKLYYQMLESCMIPNDHVFVAVLKACISIAALIEGKLIHAHSIENGFESDVFVGSVLIDLYSKCGSLGDAFAVFDKMFKRDVVTWNVMLSACANHGCGWDTVRFYEQMQEEDIKPDPVTYVALLKAFSSTAAIDQGRIIHAHVIIRGYEWDVMVCSTLVDMYCKVGNLNDAHRLFNRMPRRNVITWNTLIMGYTQQGHGHVALELFQNMQLEGLEPDNVTFLSILKACNSISTPDQGKLFHAYIIQSGFELDLHVGSTLIDMYAKCGNLEDARRVFDKLPKRSVVTWNGMITGYADHGYCQEALELFQEMQQDGLHPDDVTFSSIVKACSSITAVTQIQLIHASIIESGLESDVAVGSILIDILTRCGHLEDAHGVFDRLPKRDAAIWNTMIAGYALHHDYAMALKYFEGMQQQGLEPDDVTFVCLLSACSHSGSVIKGFDHLKSMREKFGITPTFEHYNCIVDLLGRAGFLKEAEDLLRTLPFLANISCWRSLLSHCKTYGHVELGRRCFHQLVTIDHGDASGYVLMSTIYVDAYMAVHIDKLQQLRKCTAAWKKPAKAFIEVDNEIHGFIVGEQSHPLCDDIYAKVTKLKAQFQIDGYVPHLNSVLESMSDAHINMGENCDALLSINQGTALGASQNL